MDLSELIMHIQQLTPQLAFTCCVVNGSIMTLKEIEDMGYEEFCYRSRINIPLKLYKYFPDKEVVDKMGNKVNYSNIALKNNTVYMQEPRLFDDIYDSDINIDFYQYQKYRLMEYCRRCGLVIDDGKSTEEIGTELLKIIIKSIENNNDFSHIFSTEGASQIESLTNEIFKNKIIVGLENNKDIGQVVFKIMEQEYQDYVKELKNTFRISCFATTYFLWYIVKHDLILQRN